MHLCALTRKRQFPAGLQEHEQGCTPRVGIETRDIDEQVAEGVVAQDAKPVHSSSSVEHHVTHESASRSDAYLSAESGGELPTPQAGPVDSQAGDDAQQGRPMPEENAQDPGRPSPADIPQSPAETDSKVQCPWQTK